MLSLLNKIRSTKPESLTARARKLSVDDLAQETSDFFAVKRPKTNKPLIMSCAGVALFLTAAATGFAYHWNTASEDTVVAASAENSAAPTTAQNFAGVITSTSTKGDFAGQIANAVAASPVKPISVAYLGGNSVSDPAASTSLLPQSDYPTPSGDALAYGEPTVLENSIELSPPLQEGAGSSVQKSLPAEPIDERVVLKGGDTLVGHLINMGVNPNSAQAVAAAIEPVYPGRLVRAGQEYIVTLDKEQNFYGNDVIAPVRVAFTPPGGEEIVIESDADGRYIATISGKKAEPRRIASDAPYFRAKAKVSSSVYAAARDNGVPKNVINSAMNVLGHGLDLQRQVHAGDTLDLFYGVPLSGSSTKRKVLHYAKLRSGGRNHIYYRFTDRNGRTAYYDEKGIGASKSLMATPISGARITSGFGMRRHPILGYNKLHTGIDFGAPRGTPIKSAGNGVVEYVGWRGAYGRTVIIKHGKKYSTLYAHMKKTAKLRRGQKVRQGQVIGYVGTTGRSTGPHLHYEIRKNNRPVNPRRVKLANKTRLTGSDLKAFKRHKNKILALMDKAPSSLQIAQASGQ